MKIALIALALAAYPTAFANSVDDAFNSAVKKQSSQKEQKKNQEEASKKSLRQNQLIKAATMITAKMGTSVAELGSVSVRNDPSNPSTETVKLKTKSGLVCQVEFDMFREDNYLARNIERQLPTLEALCGRKAPNELAEVQANSSTASRFFSSNGESDLNDAYASLRYSCNLNQWEARGDCYDSRGNQSYMGVNEVMANELGVRIYDSN
ncbi:MAG: hypothetical protein AB7K68_00645 [Bacteriovoracia bacterium]